MTRPERRTPVSLGTLVGLLLGMATALAEEPSFELDDSGQAVEVLDEPSFELDETGQAVETPDAPDTAPAADETSPDPEQSAEETRLREIEIFGIRPRVLTPLPGVILDEGQASSNIQQSTGQDIRESGAVSTTQFLNERLQSITVQDNTGNPFQQDVVFRGFSASPLLATPQGLSIYLDGVRVNEPFGQVVNWDLIPLNAIETLALIPGSNPLFGLNTLGGALSLSTKSGFTAPGVEASQTYGSWGRQQTEFTAGAGDEHVAGLLAINYLREDGWRRNSPSAINQAFARADAKGDWGQVTVQGLHADNELFGGGLIPDEDYRIDPTQVYTAPDGVFNQLNHFWATGRADLHDELSASVLSYHRRSQQETINGDFWDDWVEAAAERIPACDVAPGVPPAPGQIINGALNEPVIPGGPPNTGISGCIVNGSLGTSLSDQKSHGLGLQLNWVNERNQMVLGATYDSDSTLFEQAEQLGFILADRTVVAEPDRTSARTTIQNIEVNPDGTTRTPEEIINGLISAPSSPAAIVLRFVETGCWDENNPRTNANDLGNRSAFGIDIVCTAGDFADARAKLAMSASPVAGFILGELAGAQALKTAALSGVTTVASTANTRFGDSVAAAARPVLQNRVLGSNRTMAAYLFDVWTLKPGLNLSFGARYSVTRVTTQTQNEADRALFNVTRAALDSLIPRCRGPGDPPRPADNITRDPPFFTCREETHQYSALNPAVGLSVDITPTINVFGNVSRGSRTPSAVELACARPSREDLVADPGLRPGCTIPTALSNDPFLPQVRSTTYEVGSRGRLGAGLNWDFAIYQTDLTDDILFVAYGFGNRGVFDSFGRTRRRGLEFGLNGELKGIKWFANYSHVEATFQSSAFVVNLNNSSSDKETIATTNLLEGEFVIEAGDRLPGVPLHALRAGFSMDVTPRWGLSMNMVAQANSFVRGNENNEHQAVGDDRSSTRPNRRREYIGAGDIEGFAIFNLDMEYRFTRQWLGFLQIDNIFNSRFVTAGQLGLNAFPSIFPSDPAFGVRDPSGFSNNSNDWTHSTFVGPGAPRAAWVGVRFSF